MLLTITFLVGCTLNYPLTLSAAVNEPRELMLLIEQLKNLDPKQAEQLFYDKNFVKHRKSSKNTLFSGKLSQDSLCISIMKESRRVPKVFYDVEIINKADSWSKLEKKLIEMEYLLKNLFVKSPISRVTQGPNNCLGNQLNCIKNGKMEYNIIWYWQDTKQVERSFSLYLNSRANIVIRVFMAQS